MQLMKKTTMTLTEISMIKEGGVQSHHYDCDQELMNGGKLKVGEDGHDE